MERMYWTKKCRKRNECEEMGVREGKNADIEDTEVTN